jgi:hypothetical protein
MCTASAIAFRPLTAKFPFSRFRSSLVQRKAYPNSHLNQRLCAGRHFTMSSAKQEPKVTKISALSSDEAKWIEFNKIEYTDQDGKK